MKDLLLLLCKFPYDESERDNLSRQLVGVKDWDKFVRLINSHGIIALAAYNIKEAKLEAIVPHKAMAILENGMMQSIVRNTWLTERWKEVNSILTGAGIKQILLKGMALEHTLYCNRGLRQMNDNDILIKPEESQIAWELLQNNGYKPEPLKSQLFEKIRFNIGRHLPALYKNGYTLEIHDRLLDVNGGKENLNEDPFTMAKKILVAETEALILSPEMQLKHLINHYEHHALSGDCPLRLYTDIMLLDKDSKIQIPDRFIENPIQSSKPEFLKATYKATVRTVPPKYRLRFVVGDTFPSLKWMKKRYKCGTIRALLHYPVRIAKLWWLV